MGAKMLLLRSPSAALLLTLLLASSVSAEESAVVEIVAVEGKLVTVRAENGSTRQYQASRDLRVVTPSHHEIRLIDLRPGEKVRVIVGKRRTEDATHLTAHGIVVVHDREPAALLHAQETGND